MVNPEVNSVPKESPLPYVLPVELNVSRSCLASLCPTRAIRALAGASCTTLTTSISRIPARATLTHGGLSRATQGSLAGHLSSSQLQRVHHTVGEAFLGRLSLLASYTYGHSMTMVPPTARATIPRHRTHVTCAPTEGLVV